eukprot:184358-Rhodomonas_salina.1
MVGTVRNQMHKKMTRARNVEVDSASCLSILTRTSTTASNPATCAAGLDENSSKLSITAFRSM